MHPGTARLVKPTIPLLVDAGAITLSNGMVGIPPSVQFLNSPEKVLVEEGTVIYADVWLAASDADDHRFSRFTRYYWAGREQTWLPMEVISFYARLRKADPFF